jgi:hypothetical protein
LSLDATDRSLGVLLEHLAKQHNIDPDAAVAFAATSRAQVDATNAGDFVEQLAASRPYLVQQSQPAAQPTPAPATPEEQAEQERYEQGVQIGKVIDHARQQAGLEPLFTAHYDNGDAA